MKDAFRRNGDHHSNQCILEVISGCMFSGKTEELIRRVNRAKYANLRVLFFNHIEDNKRYDEKHANSHSGLKYPAEMVASSAELYQIASGSGVHTVAIDEAQFFDLHLADVADLLADEGFRVIVAGLNQDFKGDSFGDMARLIYRADHVTTLSAICVICGKDATRTQRLLDGEPAPYSSPVKLVGGAESYQARCRSCHLVPGKPLYSNKNVRMHNSIKAS